MGKLSSPSAEALIATSHPYTITSRSLPFQVKAVSQQAQKLLTRNTWREMDRPRISTNKITCENAMDPHILLKTSENPAEPYLHNYRNKSPK